MRCPCAECINTPDGPPTLKPERRCRDLRGRSCVAYLDAAYALNKPDLAEVVDWVAAELSQGTEHGALGCLTVAELRLGWAQKCS